MSFHALIGGPASGRTITFVRHFATSREDLWDALTDPDRLSEWLTGVIPPVTLEPRVGGRVLIRFPGEGGQVDGEVLAWEPPTLLHYTWLVTGEPPTDVRFELAGTDEGSTLTLVHQGFPGARAPGYGAGWHAYLDSLHGDLGNGDWDARFAAVLPGYRALYGDELLVPGPEAAYDEVRKALIYRRRFPTTPAGLWAAITEPEQARQWLDADLTLEPRVGGTVRIDFNEKQYVDGKVLVWEPYRVFEHEWVFVDEKPAVLRYEIEPDGEDACVLTLTHSGIEPDDLVDYGAGWHAFLDRLLAQKYGADLDDAMLDALLKPRYHELFT